jgi:predicted ATPase
VLFFDDLHWADASTVDLLAYVGRHCQGLRVLVVVTYRPTELLLGPHPFHRVKLELQGRGVCTELPLGFLGRADVERYLALAFPGHVFPADFAGLVHARTEGSPLFLAGLLGYLRERGVVAERGGRWVLARELPDLWQELPESVRGMIQRQLERLGADDRRLLAAASVQGHEFDSAVLAGALGRDPAEVEERLQALDRVHGLVRLVREDEFPDRALTLRYAFVHGLYQQALYGDLSPSRRAALGVALARVLEGHHREGSPAVAAELACLYEVGRDFARAARQFRLAAENAARVFAHREAVGLARRGLRLLEALPETPERDALELPLQTTLGLQLQVTEGFAAPAAGQAYTRARVLCQRAPGSPPLFPVLWGLWLSSKVRSELARALQLAEELQALAQQHGDPALALQAHQALAMTSFCRGEPAVTLRHMEQATALYDLERHRTNSTVFGQDPGVACKAFGAVALWLLGYPDEARRQSEAALELSHRLEQPSSQTLALHFAAMLHQLRGDVPRAGACADACGVFAAEHGFSFWMAGGAVMSGWALAAGGVADEGVARLRRGLRDWQATSSLTYRTYYLGLLAEVLAGQGQVAEAGRVLEEALALARRTGEGLYEAELLRLRGELLLRGPGEPAAAEAHFRQALEVARQQGAKSLELRAAISLARPGRPLGAPGEARARLAETYGWFTEGLQTPDLQEARGLLESPA